MLWMVSAAAATLVAVKRPPAAVAASMLRRDIDSMTSSPRYGCGVTRKAGSWLARELHSVGAAAGCWFTELAAAPLEESTTTKFCFDLVAHQASPEHALIHSRSRYARAHP